MDSFVNITLNSALLEITVAKKQYISIPNHPLETWEWIEQCFQPPTSTNFCGR